MSGCKSLPPISRKTEEDCRLSDVHHRFITGGTQLSVTVNGTLYLSQSVRRYRDQGLLEIAGWGCARRDFATWRRTSAS